MGSGAFRDTSAALERVRMLDDEVEALKAENASLRDRADALLAGLDKNKLGAELRKTLQERDALRRENEDQRLASIAAAQRLKEEHASKVAALQNAYDSKVALLEARLDPATQALDHAYAARDPALNAHKLVQITKERDAFAIRVATGVKSGETNITAFLKRVIDERDELLCELQRVREAHASMPAPRSFFGRIFR